MYFQEVDLKHNISCGKELWGQVQSYLLHKSSAATKLRDRRAEVIRAEVWCRGKATGPRIRRQGFSAWPATNSLGRAGRGQTSAYLFLEGKDYVLYTPLLPLLPLLLLFLQCLLGAGYWNRCLTYFGSLNLHVPENVSVSPFYR